MKAGGPQDHTKHCQEKGTELCTFQFCKLHVQVFKSKRINYITIGTLFSVLSPKTPSLAMVLSAFYSKARGNCGKAVALYLICQDQQHQPLKFLQGLDLAYWASTTEIKSLHEKYVSLKLNVKKRWYYLFSKFAFILQTNGIMIQQ